MTWLEALYSVPIAAVVAWLYWWQTAGRREAQRELIRREHADARERERRMKGPRRRARGG